MKSTKEDREVIIKMSAMMPNLMRMMADVVSDMYNLEEALDKALIAARLFKEELEIVKEENDSLYREMEKLKTFH
tara:strand:- start:50 stop:274 length:225 start_codon:yes stop_codon:yes gene_type:complete